MIRRSSLACLALGMVVGVSAAVPQQQPSARSARAGGASPPKEVVLFPFDDYSIPLTYGLTHGLIQGHREGVVLRPGKSGPDAQHIINHGSVLRVGDEFRMWYLATGDQDAEVFLERPPESGDPSDWERDATFRVCYATSKDGINWERPALGLVDYGGNKQNNLVEFDIGNVRVINLIVIEDPEDPDPARRFKMAFQTGKYQSRVAVAFSPDGLRWKEFSGNPVSRHMSEIHGLIKYNGVYYVNGHGGSPRTVPTRSCRDG